MQQTEDQVYINKVKNGDPASFAYLVDRYKNMAYTIALRILRNVEDAEDAAQESFVKAYQQLHQFESKSKFSTWLYTIVYRVSVSKLKEKRILAVEMSDTIIEEYTSDFAVPQLENINLAEQQKYIKEAIARLPETEGLLITLFYMNDSSVKEIEAIIGLSESNIKVKLFRARKILEEQLRFLM